MGEIERESVSRGQEFLFGSLRADCKRANNWEIRSSKEAIM